MDALMAEIHRDVNNGVYRCGFATTQQAYDEAFEGLFTTLVRFDVAYHGHFNYYATHNEINPTGIVPLGPDLRGWTTPHGRG
jgi:glutathionyl-hydroquinone reductase